MLAPNRTVDPPKHALAGRQGAPGKPLVLHGEDDQIVPVKDSAVKSARLIKGAQDVYYPGAPHGITATHQDQVNADLLNFLKEERKAHAA